ncbi:amidohydrolase [Mycobacterium sp. LTG2003]
MTVARQAVDDRVRELCGQFSTGAMAEAVDLYRDLHRHPELSMQEHRTQKALRAALNRTSAEVRECAGTGLVAVLRNGPGPVIAMRADIDALPLQELTGLGYASRAVGTLPDGNRTPVMHACGHDVHASALVAALGYLDRRRDTWSGTLVAVFQPGEETGAGAAAMIEDGIFGDTGMPEAIYAQHVTTGPIGLLICRPGFFLSHQRSWRITVDGHGGHASRPHLARDPVVASAAMILRLQAIVSREIDPFRMAVLSVGSIHGGTAPNVIPDRVTFTVTTRNYEPAVGDRLVAAMHRVIAAEATASEVRARVDAVSEIPACNNDPDETATVRLGLASLFGAAAVHSPDDPLPASDDFSQYARQLGIPSVMWNFGCQDPSLFSRGGAVPRNHTSRFAPHLDALTVGAAAAVAVLRHRFAIAGSKMQSLRDGAEARQQ